MTLMKASQERVSANLVTILYLCFLLVATVYKYYKPVYNWDSLPYMALLASADGASPEQAHQIAYSEARRTIPASTYRSFTDTNGVLSKRMAASAEDFHALMPFYIIKPLYLGAAYILHKASFSLARSVFLPSVISYCLIGLLLFYWIGKHVSKVFAAIISALLLMSAPLLEAASYAAADCLSALVLLAAFYFLLEKKSITGMYIFLLLAVFARLDNIIVAFLLVVFGLFGKKLPVPISKSKGFMLVAGLVAAYFLTTSLVTIYGWNPFFLPAFFKQHYETFYREKTSSAIYDFVKQRHSALMVAMLHYHLFIYLGFAVLLFLGNKTLRWKDLSFDQAFLTVLITTIGIRAVVYTDLSDRYFVGYSLVIVILLVRRFKHGAIGDAHPVNIE